MTKLGRNDPCSCGSGKKYKKCCLASLKTHLPDNPFSPDIAALRRELGLE